MRTGRDDEAYAIFTDMLNEEPHLSPLEKKGNRVWFVKTREELRKIDAPQKAV
jgi:hypothetical protein